MTWERSPDRVSTRGASYNRYVLPAADGRVKGDFAALVKEAATGDRDAMERLLIRAQEVAYRFSLLVCGHPEDAEDVMQDALLKTYQHVQQIAEPHAFRTWLYTTVRNACLMKRRRHAGEPAAFVSIEQGIDSAEGATPVDIPDQAPPADQQLIDRWIDKRLRDALQRLPRFHRMVLILREIEGLSTREVAAITGLSEANVKTRVHRARLILRQRLGEET
jgi:RNA polymerase sigma-70 factor, ECF subfamily